MVAKTFTTPFALNGNKTPVPNPADPGGAVSYDQGFGPDYERQLGVDPLAKDISRENFNSVVNDITTSLQEFQAGEGSPPFSAALAASRPGAGYAKNAVIPRSDNNGYWISTTAANADNPEVTFGKWAPLNVQGVLTQALTNVNVTLSLLNAGIPTIVFTGVLTGNVQVIVPAWVYSYYITNNCTGAFTVTVKTAVGTGVVVANGAKQIVRVDPAGVTAYSGNAAQVFSVAAAIAGEHAINLNEFLVQLANPGYIKIPVLSGAIKRTLIIQWVSQGAVTTAGATIPFPIAFPGAVLAAWANVSAASTTLSIFASPVAPVTLTNITVTVNTASAAVAAFAIGF